MSDDGGYREWKLEQNICALAKIAERQLETIDEQKVEIRKLRSMCRAAAAEISETWDAHCDAEGCGPVNLMARLEGRLPPDLYPAFDDK